LACRCDGTRGSDRVRSHSRRPGSNQLRTTGSPVGRRSYTLRMPCRCIPRYSCRCT
jgi:hypothetical protein